MIKNILYIYNISVTLHGSIIHSVKTVVLSLDSSITQRVQTKSVSSFSLKIANCKNGGTFNQKCILRLVREQLLLMVRYNHCNLNYTWFFFFLSLGKMLFLMTCGCVFTILSILQSSPLQDPDRWLLIIQTKQTDPNSVFVLVQIFTYCNMTHLALADVLEYGGGGSFQVHSPSGCVYFMAGTYCTFNTHNTQVN